ncbi:MAG: hypothetical protein ACTHM1_06530 [Solirubrobacteraceae bacterium]
MRQLIRHSAILGIATALVLAAVLFANACASATGGTPIAQVSPAGLDSETLASRRATQLLRQLLLPGGSRSLSRPPSSMRSLSSPSQMPLVKTLVDRHAFWSVPLDPARAVAWIAGHAPRSWRLSERGGTSSSGVQQSWELGFSPPGANLADGGVLVTAVAGPRGKSVVRVDAQSVWYPPRPHASLVPPGVTQLTVAVARERGSDHAAPPSSPVTIVNDPAKVRAVALAVNRLHVDVDLAESCAMNLYPGTYVWLSFREHPDAPAVAEARLSPYECSGGGSVVLRVRGRLAPTLSGGVQLIGEIESILGRKLKGLRPRFSQKPKKHSASSPPSAPIAPARVPKTRILAIALAAAKADGDSTPTLVQHVLSTRRRAVRVTSGGDLVEGEEPVYAVEVRGHFLAANASRPLGAPPPRGSVLTLVLDASTGKPLDWGLSNTSAHLGRLGRVIVDLRARG